MPIPLIIAGLGAAGIGALGHMSAKKTNEQAQSISADAQRIYNNAKNSLEKAQLNTEEVLLKLGYSKKNILDGSMKSFLESYEKIKEISFVQTVGLDELSRFNIDQQDVLQLQEMSNIYEQTIKSGASGAAAGAVVALAASGSLSIVTSELALAGSFLAAGQVSAAAGIAGSALSFGATMTPLAAVAAPVVMFTGISASMKADDNLLKAETMYSEAVAAAEKMKLSETLCAGISGRSEMLNEVLLELNVMFAECVGLLASVIKKKEGRIFKKQLTSADFSEDDLKLVAVTRALAGAIKAVIDTPILTSEGTISEESQDVYEQTMYRIPDFSQAVEEVKAIDYSTKTIVVEEKRDGERPHLSEKKKEKQIYHPNLLVALIMWILCISTVFCGFCMAVAGGIIPGFIWIFAGVKMCPRTKSTMKFFARLGLMLLLLFISIFLV